MLSVIIPARNEAACIGSCLGALATQTLDPEKIGGVEVIVVANGCSDETAVQARDWADRLSDVGMTLRVIELPEAGKALALDRGDCAAAGGLRVYLDADVVPSPPLLGQIAAALDVAEPRFAGGTLVLDPPRSRASRAFARVWTRLPFLSEVAPSPGLYAVNAAGRARWGRFPDIISDDSFVRGSFDADERVQVPAEYRWPLAEGAWRIVRARRRQEVGIRELEMQFPGLRLRPAQRHNLGRLARIALRDPAGTLVYAALTGLAKLTADPADRRWNRSR